MKNVQTIAELAGRILMSMLFLLSGFVKIGAYAKTVAYMASLGVPGVLLPVVIATEVIGPLAIIVGWKTRIVAFLLAGYSLLTAVVFHSNVGDPTQEAMFFKNVAIAGGFLLLMAHGAGAWSLDARIAKSVRMSD